MSQDTDEEVEELLVEEISCSSSDAKVEVEEDDDGLLFLDEGNLVDDDEEGKMLYLKWCEKLRVPPVSQILKFLNGRSIPINHYGICPRGLYALAQALRVNTTVETISLSHNNITAFSGGLTSFFEILSGNRTLKRINLSGNRIGENGCKALSSFLSEPTCVLKEVNLSNNKLNDRNIKCILEALAKNDRLEILDLSRNCLTGKCSGSLHDFLVRNNTTLRALDLSWNTLKAKGSERIATALTQDATLRRLDLSWNGIQDEGVLLFCDQIGQMNIEELGLVGNGITDEGFLAILEALSQCKGGLEIKTVRMDQNYIHEDQYLSAKGSTVYKDIASVVVIDSNILKLGFSNLK